MGVAGPGEACGGACTEANHALKVGIITGEADGGREAVGSGGMGRLDGQAGCEVEGALRVKREGCGRGAVLGERGQWRYRRGRA